MNKTCIICLRSCIERKTFENGIIDKVVLFKLVNVTIPVLYKLLALVVV